MRLFFQSMVFSQYGLFHQLFLYNFLFRFLLWILYWLRTPKSFRLFSSYRRLFISSISNCERMLAICRWICVFSKVTFSEVIFNWPVAWFLPREPLLPLLTLKVWPTISSLFSMLYSASSILNWPLVIFALKPTPRTDCNRIHPTLWRLLFFFLIMSSPPLTTFLRSLSWLDSLFRRATSMSSCKSVVQCFNK